MKRKATAITLILAILIIFIAEIPFTSLVRANPNPWATTPIYRGDVTPPKNATPPLIILLSPDNQSFHQTNNITFTLNVIPVPTSLQYSSIQGGSPTGIAITRYIISSLKEIYFQTDYEENKTYLEPNEAVAFNLTGIPDGNHSITIYAVEWRPYQILSQQNYSKPVMYPGLLYNGFNITGSLVIEFTVGVPPVVSHLSLENRTYNSNDVPLVFNVNEYSWLGYSLDNEANVTIAGNTTLTGLPNGDHNVTVYATDEGGNIGASETIFFSVEVPFPTALVLASTASVAFVGVGLLVYFKKRKR